MKILCNYFDHIHTPTPQLLPDPLLSLYPQIHLFDEKKILFLITHQIQFVLNCTQFKDAFC